MDEDAAPPVDPDDPDTIQWRRDASTSRTVRLLWSLGVGTLFAAIGIIVFWRLYDLAGQVGGQSILLAALAAVVVTILALAVSSNAGKRLEQLLSSLPLPIDSPSDRGLARALDAAVGTLVMGVVIAVLMGLGRLIAQSGQLEGIGAGLFTGLAALSLPLAIVALVLSAFLRSVGALDRDEEQIHLFDPDHRIDLSLISAVSSRDVGDATVVTLEYEQPDDQYVAGPRRIAVPPAVAAEIRSIVGTRRRRLSERVTRQLRRVGRRLRGVVRR
ncbi:hypothetical protein [Natronobacterium gregoryi]|uniref:Uncharacterized protein n=2 Tax=Natronobacterium gregoryi TaxID=44930 RepID=L0AFN9_NATGS|nr:hypothetical protein [Natronobacterium gregoryi]AFZ72616.1 hypothetical protein Natgr_1405 [Natronobacterium gregoryi SP2]ELY71956.1 hypothetical protein C490_04312 [Natronobacterium gregoryi SP2]PLK19216.1 hypothetical protein CYV19_16165 [Natronobacterium gregoryi SP2]SFJ57675.1 hypothetical protein SAMN05443661_14125 [Natronobacterium gregoryi]